MVTVGSALGKDQVFTVLRRRVHHRICSHHAVNNQFVGSVFQLRPPQPNWVALIVVFRLWFRLGAVSNVLGRVLRLLLGRNLDLELDSRRHPSRLLTKFVLCVNLEARNIDVVGFVDLGLLRLGQPNPLPFCSQVKSWSRWFRRCFLRARRAIRMLRRRGLVLQGMARHRLLGSLGGLFIQCLCALIWDIDALAIERGSDLVSELPEGCRHRSTHIISADLLEIMEGLELAHRNILDGEFRAVCHQRSLESLVQVRQIGRAAAAGRCLVALRRFLVSVVERIAYRAAEGHMVGVI